MRIVGAGRATIPTATGNNMMKRIFCIVAVLVFVCAFCACGEGGQNVTTAPSTTAAMQKTSVTTTVATTTAELTVPVTEITDDGYLYSVEDNGVVVTGYTGGETSVEIPQTIDGKQVVEIGFEAFKNSNLKNVKIPFGVKKIGAFAFFGSPLESVEIPETVTFIGNNAFSYTNLTDFEMPLGISTVSAEMFSFCDRLESVVIGSNITQIDYGAFAFCQSLEAVYIPYSVDYIADDAFEGWFDLVLYGEEESYAQQYAEDMGMEFEVV